MHTLCIRLKGFSSLGTAGFVYIYIYIYIYKTLHIYCIYIHKTSSRFCVYIKPASGFVYIYIYIQNQQHIFIYLYIYILFFVYVAATYTSPTNDERALARDWGATCLRDRHFGYDSLTIKQCIHMCICIRASALAL